jgi:hypothetical protein
VSDRHLDALRDELRARGYLDARVDRFVLGAAARRERPLGVAAAASLRIGLLAGVLLGPAAAIGLRSRAPGLVTNAIDAAVLSVYLGVLFWVAAAILSALAVLAGSAIARRLGSDAGAPRRYRRAATITGVLVGVACLSYLTLWWRTAAGLAGATSILSSLSAMTVAVSISLLLGHAVAVTVLACLVRLGLAPEARELPMSSIRSTIPLGLLALGGAFMLLLAAGPGTPEPAEPPQLTVVPTGLRSVVLAVDGVDPATVDRLAGAGRLPTFSTLLSQGVAATAADADRDPARVWTTIATAQPPDRHGIRSLESREVAGLAGRLRADSSGWALLAGATDVVRLTRPTIASGDERLIQAFWEVAARAGFRTASVHWWATWPVPANSGIVLSDRAILRLEHPGALDAEIAPPSLYERLQASWPDRRAKAIARAERLNLTGISAEPAAALRRSAELDATIAGLALEPFDGTLDLLAVYLPGLDIAQSTLAGGTGRSLTPASAAERGPALERYYEFIDGLIADVLTAMPATDRLAVLITQPGRAAAAGTQGRLALSGTGLRSTRTTGAPTAITPTLLYALGLPVARDLASGPATDLFDPAFVTRYPIRLIDTYGSRVNGTRARSSQSLDREMIERMRSLGYVR